MNSTFDKAICKLLDGQCEKHTVEFVMKLLRISFQAQRCLFGTVGET